MLQARRWLKRSGHLGAMIAVVVAVGVRGLLDPVLGDHLPFVTLFAAVAFAAWAGGVWAALVATLAGYVACDYWFIEPRGRFGLNTPAGVAGTLAYAATCAIIIACVQAMRAAQWRASVSSELLRITFGSIGDGVIATDPAAIVTSLNTVAEELTGWTHDEAVGQPLERVFHIVNEQSREPVTSPVRRALAEGVVVGLANHTVLIRKDGTECPIEDSAAPIRDAAGEIAGCVLVFRDASERREFDRRSAEQLATARRLAAIVESSNDAIVGKSLDGIIQSWNEAAERLFGFTASEAIGRHISVMRFRPDIVLLDIGLPQLNGFDACRRIREQPWGRPMVLIALTGWGQDEDRRKSREAGFDAHLVKPVDYDALTALIVSLAPRATHAG